jgi:hypothetical protein
MPYGTVNADLMTTSDGVSSSGLYGFKNRIINGAMVISQRNGTSSVTPADSSFPIDRFVYFSTQASKFTAGQNLNSATTPIGFSNYLGLQTASSVSIGAGDYFMVNQLIEGFNTADLQWGTANAKTVTLSFQVYSSLTGTFGGVVTNSALNRSYPFTYTISSANTWTSISITIAGDTTGTWIGATNGCGIRIMWGLGVGSTYSGTAGAWAGATYFSATSAVSVVGTASATFYITGVQLEKGSTATSFDYRPYGTELVLCERYYQLAEGFGGTAFGGGFIGSAIQFKTEMRTSPSTSATAAIQITYAGVADYTQSSANASIVAGRVSSRGVYIACSNFTGLVNSIFHQQNVSVNNAAIALSAEL